MNIFERSLSPNTPGLGLDKKKWGLQTSWRKHQEEKERGEFILSCFQFLPNLKGGEYQEIFALSPFWDFAI